ncbi:ribosomal protein S18-alanine N-acetyltransferase [Pontibacillus sp. HMF3514]|uniref:ribosomal protein S18-alanine N-acetyltransferase n=1 Tax=Pontibacillus sp. HMF3514 TaxID=2692425 RepID=UPI0013200690|nr:ribosomal protein S18-alanine N-acetyltransferase [Pontibacillus sp. HMF3514]QHE54178.1 ribosomal protein S18-alanine N-acetyltransferase [Pontibacillus sp. HMF3514]
MAPPVVRTMVEDDINTLLDIEEACFATPWTWDSFLYELKENPYATYYVMELDGVIIGYCGLWLIIDEAHITNIAIMPDYRGYKYGNFLFSHVLEKAREAGAIQLSLEVRVSNIVAQKMYRKYGLIPGEIRKRYYTDNQEDALVMWVKL